MSEFCKAHLKLSENTTTTNLRLSDLISCSLSCVFPICALELKQLIDLQSKYSATLLIIN